MRLMKPLLMGLLGGLAGCGIACYAGIMMPKEHSHSQDIKMVTPRPMYEIVDEYKSCDVVRYTDIQGSQNYFLHCN